MSTQKPTLVAINHDEYEAKYVGRLADGRQFFCTNPFVPGGAGPGSGEFLALYLFSPEGRLLEARIESYGVRSKEQESRCRADTQTWLASLGEIEFGRIEIQPFSVERFGVEFGLIASPPDDDADYWLVRAQPGDYMAFYEPWDSGEYDT
jgi:hypothetical protein